MANPAADTAPVSPAYIAIDVETTGLATDADLLEIAVLLVGNDAGFAILDHVNVLVTPQSIPHCGYLPNSYIDSVGETPRNMHYDNGLWEDLNTALTDGSAYSVHDVDNLIVEMLNRHGVTPDNRLPLLGSSPSFDRRIVDRNLPRTAELMNHHTVDATTLKELLERTYSDTDTTHGILDTISERAADEVSALQATTGGHLTVKHRALFDIVVSLRQIAPFLDLLATTRAPATVQ